MIKKENREQRTENKDISLYIHVPFCADKKCDYCDFYSVPAGSVNCNDDSLFERFVRSLLSEGEKLFDKYRPGNVPSVYIGGGTPSVLGPAGIKALLQGLMELISRYSERPGEITVEANPESADEAFLAAIREGGASRLSLGVESFCGSARRAVHRIGDEALLPGRLALAESYFPGAYSADLLSGLPFQNEGTLLDDIAALLSRKPAHVSLYSLTVEPRTPLAGNRQFLPSRDQADSLWLAGRNALEKSGYSQYEVSNFCLSGKESRHNIRYWRMQNWLALGPSASGTVINDKTGTGFRYTYPPDLDAWFAAPRAAVEELDRPVLVKESLLMGFRYIEGPDEDLFRLRFHRGIGEVIPQTLAKWRKQGLLQENKAALNKEGLLFLNGFLLDAFMELDDPDPP